MREKPSGVEFRGQGEQSGLNLASSDQIFSDFCKLRWLISFSFHEFSLIAGGYLLLSLQRYLERGAVTRKDTQSPGLHPQLCRHRAPSWSYDLGMDSPLLSSVTAGSHVSSLCSSFSFVKQMAWLRWGVNKTMRFKSWQNAWHICWRQQ